MKKLTKKKLDELAKEMPLVSQDEKESIFGRARYYDMQGSPIDVCGDSSEIRVIDRSVYIASLGAALGSTDPNSAKNNLVGSSSFKHATTELRGSIIRSIAVDAGVNSSYLTVGTLSYSRFGQYDPNNGMITINNNSTLFEYGNYNDFYLNLKHENYHRNNYNPELSDAKMESDACNHVMDQNQFDYASPYYQGVVTSNYQQY